jgi:hypothetical protein
MQKWIIGMALERKLILGECFSKQGINYISAMMTKIFIINESRIHHHNACIASNDFGECYDRIAHPVDAISPQSWGVPQQEINSLLKTMETMRFFLRT